MHKQTTSAEKSSILALIKDLMSKTEVVYTEEQLDKLATLVCLLSQWNNALNLTAIRDPKQMVVKQRQSTILCIFYYTMSRILKCHLIHSVKC